MRKAIIVITAVAVLTLSACGSGLIDGQGGEPEAPDTISSTDTGEEGDEPSQPTDDKAPVAIGRPFAYDDGLTVAITGTQRSTISHDGMAGQPGDPRLIVTVKISNGTKSNFGTEEAIMNVSYGKNGDQAEELYTYDGFSGTIPRGRARSAKFDYLIKDKNGFGDLIIEVTPDWEHGPAIFQGAAK